MKRVVIAAAALSVVALAIWSTRRGAEQPSPALPSAQPAAPTASPVTSRAPTEGTPCHFLAGQRFAFELKTQATAKLSGELGRYGLSDDRQETTSSATLNVEVLSDDGHSAVLLSRLLNGTNGLAGADVSQPWLARVNERCEVAGFARHVSTSKLVGRQQQAVLHELWFTVPSGVAVTGADFDNAMGRASALVSFEREPSAEVVIRRIERFRSAWAPAMNGLVVEGSTLVVRRSEGPWFQSMEGAEAYSVPGVVTSAQATFTATATPFDASAFEGASRVMNEYVWESCFDQLPSAETRTFTAADHQQRVEAMKNVSYPDALEKMLATFAVPGTLHDQSRDMAAFLDAHPEQIHEYAGALLTEFEPEWKAAGFLVLANTQHALAREVLFDVWRERDAPMMERSRASLALVSRRDVGVSLARELLGEARRSGTPSQRNVSQQALLHAGILSALHPDDVETKLEVQRGLVVELGARLTPMERAPVYSAIGNTGDPAFLAEVQRASRNPDPEWRKIVPVALRRMKVDDTRDLTLEWLRRETSPDVMRELYDIVQQQYEDQGRVVDDELAAEAVGWLREKPRLLTRQSLVQLLKPLVGTNEAVRAAMKETLKLEYETRTGMFPFVASCLSDEDVREVLSTIPTLADQHRGVGQAPPPSQPAPRPSEPGPELMPKFPAGEAP